jgi:hypothetical protein
MISICIPSVWGKTGQRFIKTTFEEAGWGEIEHIDIIPIHRTDQDDLFKKVFVHFKTCNDDIRKQLDNGEQLEIVYDKEKERSWKVTKSRSTRPTETPTPRTTGHTTAAGRSTGPRATGRSTAPRTTGLTTAPHSDSRIETLQQQVQLLTQMVLMNSGVAPALGAPAIPALGAAHAAPRNYRAPKPRIQTQ